MASLAVVGLSPLFRVALAGLLGRMGFNPVEEAVDLEALQERAKDTQRPDLLLISLPRGDGDPAALMQEIQAWAPHAKVVFLAPDLDIHQLSACFAAGAAGYILDRISCDGLEHSLRLVMTGEKVLPSELARTISAFSYKFGDPTAPSEDPCNLDLSDREIEILRGVADGRSNRNIGKTLSISEAAVSVHLKHILKKIHVSNRTQAALWGVARGFARPFA